MSKYVESVYGWDDKFKYSHFERAFVPERIQIVQEDGHRVGIYELQERHDELFLARIEIAPERQRRGVGSHLLKSLISQAIEKGKPLKLHVFKVNPAQRLYRQMGFTDTGETETHVQMQYVGRDG